MLTFSGSGDMYDRVYLIKGEDFYEMTDSAVDNFSPKKIVIEDGITSIGGWFISMSYWSSIPEEFVIPESVTKICSDAFYKSGISSFTVP